MNKRILVFTTTIILGSSINGQALPTAATVDQPSEIAMKGVFTGDEGSGLDWSSPVDSNHWAPQVTRGEDGSYWAAALFQNPYSGYDDIKIFRSKGDPASAGWRDQWVITDSAHLDFPDIEVVTTADRGMVIYMKRDPNFSVKCFWFQLSDPSINGISYLGSAFEGGYLSLTTDDVNYDGASVYAYASWKYLPPGSPIPLLQYSRSIDLGMNWFPTPVTTFQGVKFMYTGNAIAYCPGNEMVQILFTDEADEDVYLSYCTFPRGDPGGAWPAYIMMGTGTLEPYTSGGITSMYGNYMLAAAHRYNPTTTSIDIYHKYSTTGGGASWSATAVNSRSGNQTYPSCTSNDDGKFSMMFFTGDTVRMESRITDYTSFGVPGGWYSGTLDDINPRTFSGINSACMEDGTDPNHGGAWSNGTAFNSYCYFGWAGSPSFGMRVDLIPVSPPPPVIVPRGSSFTYDIELENTSPASQTFDFWINVTLPNGTTVGPLLGPFIGITRPSGWNPTYTRSQYIPPTAPLGHYSWNAFIGTYPNDIWVHDNFNFEVITHDNAAVPQVPGNSSVSIDEWYGFGDPVFGEILTLEAKPVELKLLGISPNPFNPTTTISFALPEAAKVNLSIYNVSGRLVTTLVDGWRDAGLHELAFDGTGLTSGVYIYRIETGDFTSVKKMILIK
jgi:hypothetical protein